MPCCCICIEEEVQVVLLPCAHACICAGCNEVGYRRCPLCRHVVAMSIRIYL
jgi:hypothetical protein